MTRRQILAAMIAAASARAAARPTGILVDTHVHLFDPAKFPYHAAAPYKPEAQTLEAYAKFVAEARIDHAVIVHPEPYQDNHKYLEYCFEHEPSRNFFKGVCLFDPAAPDTPARLNTFARKYPGRIVGVRIHEMADGGIPPESSGAIKNRDLASPAMKNTWDAAQVLGIAIQLQFLPHYAPQIATLAGQFKDVPVILDHLGRAGQGTPAEFESVLKLAQYPGVVMKYSSVNFSSKEKFPFNDAKPMVKRIFDAFGPERMIWGGLGMTMPAFDDQVKLFDEMFAFAPESSRAQIRGANAVKLFKW